ncbi:hypothetical protein ACE1CD_06410 [Aerosakkonema sp. BLCC-F183]|uniref:hypothetical protein n=1 Tax=Aerosakkonema sp. BLCC-F183 TaxID=3342834 RepID=UPI0035BB81CF
MKISSALLGRILRGVAMSRSHQIPSRIDRVAYLSINTYAIGKTFPTLVPPLPTLPTPCVAA